MRYITQSILGCVFKLPFPRIKYVKKRVFLAILKQIVMGIGVMGAIACAPIPAVLQTTANDDITIAEGTTTEDATTMISTSGVVVHSVTLMAREEINPPYGNSSDDTRDIGFATVFFTLENTTEADHSIAVSIAVKDAETGAVQMQMEWPEPLLLRPLEYSEQAVHLSNADGFEGSRAIAVLTCQLGTEQVVLESAPVTVEQY